MFDFSLWHEIFQSINKNRMRCLLSGFTVAFAILLFTLLFGIANGLENTFKENFKDDVKNAIRIRAGKTTKPYKGLQSGRKIQLKNDDYQYIKNEFSKNIEYISGRIYKNVEANYKGNSNNYQVYAVNPDEQFSEKVTLKSGRFINQDDLIHRKKVVVIGHAIVLDLLKGTPAIGTYISLNKTPYKIIGVFSDENSRFQEEKFYMPITTAQHIYSSGNTDNIDGITLTYQPSLNTNQALAFGNTLSKKLKSRFAIAPTDQRAIRIFNAAESNKSINQMTLGLTIIILVIGFGTLIAGIVGIGNIMIFTVRERTKEIGIRKALGASPRAIVAIILLEAILITTLAGYLGLMLGIGILDLSKPLLKDYFIKDPSVQISVVLGATLTLIVAGTLAGYLPAKKASKIKPIEALRKD